MERDFQTLCLVLVVSFYKAAVGSILSANTGANTEAWLLTCVSRHSYLSNMNLEEQTNK